MAKQTLGEAIYAKDITDREHNIRHNTDSVEIQVQNLMIAMTELHDLVDDQASKTMVLALRQDMIDRLTVAVAI